jgi:hypothetical protein
MEAFAFGTTKSRSAARVYQVRGVDIANITFVRGETGWSVIDPLVSAETVRAAVMKRMSGCPRIRRDLQVRELFRMAIMAYSEGA